MGTAMIFGFILVFLTLMAFMVYFFIVFPFWALIHCSQADIHGKTKTRWIVSIVIFWTFAALIYGYWASGKPALRRSTVLFAVGALIYMGLTVWGLNWFEGRIRQEMGWLRGAVKNSSSDEGRKNKILTQLQILMAELPSPWTFKISQVNNTANFVTLLRVYAADNFISDSEFKKWSQHFEGRARLEAREFEEFVKSETGRR